MEDGASAEGLPNADRAISEALVAKKTIGPPLQTRRTRARLPDKLMLGSCVKPMEWSHPSVDPRAPAPDEA